MRLPEGGSATDQTAPREAVRRTKQLRLSDQQLLSFLSATYLRRRLFVQTLGHVFVL